MKSRTIFSGIQMNWFVVLAGVFYLTMATGASAEENKSPCAEDVAKFCKDMEKGRILQCIKDKKRTNELSPVCNQALEDAEKFGKKESNPEFQKACSTDLKEFCKGIQAGRGKMLECLKKHEADLYPECKELLE